MRITAHCVTVYWTADSVQITGSPVGGGPPSPAPSSEAQCRRHFLTAARELTRLEAELGSFCTQENALVAWHR